MFIETIGYQATAAAVAGSAAAAFAGDSLVVKNGTQGSQIKLLSAWALNQTAGFHQLTAPSFSDTTRGIRWGVAAALAQSSIAGFGYQRLTPQETISATIAATAVAGDIELGLMTIAYEDLPGQAGRYLSSTELGSRAIRQVTVFATLATGGTGGWSGAELITSESDLLRANTPYAVLGISTIVACGAVGIRSPDWSNGRIAVPGALANPDRMARYFVDLSDMAGFPCIPVFNSANKNNTFLDACVDENGADPIVTLHLVELAG